MQTAAKETQADNDVQLAVTPTDDLVTIGNLKLWKQTKDSKLNKVVLNLLDVRYCIFSLQSEEAVFATLTLTQQFLQSVTLWIELVSSCLIVVYAQLRVQTPSLSHSSASMMDPGN